MKNADIGLAKIHICVLNHESLREYCLLKPFVSEDMPFGEDVLVFRVMGKIFLLTGLDDPVLSVNLKCDPEYALQLREQYVDVAPGYHMNKRHWNTVSTGGDVPDSLLLRLVDHSYDLVLASLPRRLREQFPPE